MAGIAQLVDDMISNGTIQDILANPLAMFGRPSRPYKGAELLPNRVVPLNEFREDRIQYKTIIANDGTRYSPVQLKSGSRLGSFLVELGENDIGSQMTSNEYDTLLRMLRQSDSGTSMAAIAQVTNWVDMTINLALEEKIEQQRWQAICNAVVQRRGDNGYTEDVLYPNPVGARVTVPGGSIAVPAGLYDPTLDPFVTLDTQISYLEAKGYTIDRAFASRKLMMSWARHPLVARRLSKVVYNTGGTTSGFVPRLSLDSVNEVLSAEGLPAVERYETTYFGTDGLSQRFLPDNKLVLVALTGRSEEIDLGDNEPVVVPNTLGYAAIGRAAGQATPGRAVNIEATKGKPPTIECQGWQTQLPVITDPEAISVITYVAPA